MILNVLFTFFQIFRCWAELEKMWDKIEYGHKTKVTKTKRKEWKVKGSKGNVYKVISDDGFWSCS